MLEVCRPASGPVGVNEANPTGLPMSEICAFLHLCGVKSAAGDSALKMKETSCEDAVIDALQVCLNASHQDGAAFGKHRVPR